MATHEEFKAAIKVELGFALRRAGARYDQPENVRWEWALLGDGEEGFVLAKIVDGLVHHGLIELDPSEDDYVSESAVDPELVRRFADISG